MGLGFVVVCAAGLGEGFAGEADVDVSVDADEEAAANVVGVTVFAALVDAVSLAAGVKKVEEASMVN